jgi:hypothetical protein
MKTDAATTGIVDRCCQQVVHINDHPQHHDAEGGQPDLPLPDGLIPRGVFLPAPTDNSIP